MTAKVMLGGIEIDPAPKGKLKFNNPRVIAKIAIPGAPPAYQDMGEDETVMTWDGALIGADAYKKAIKLESLKDAGQVVQLTISDFPELSKQVRIRNFPWDVVRQDRIDYSIELVAEMPAPAVNQVLTPISLGQNQPAPTAPATQSQPTGKTYIIKQGDTLWALAVANYGDGTQWRKIADANRITDPRTLQIGQKVTIP